MISFISFVKPRHVTSQQGFSLIEMAIVMVILGMLLGGLLIPLSSQREVSHRQATERQLQEIRNALIGFAQANNRLPCPVLPGNGSNPSVAGPCGAGDGVPYAALGVQGTAINGDLVDVFQQPIHYRLTNPTPGGWVYAVAPIPTALVTPALPVPYFRVCPAAACPTVDARNVVAVVFSTGRDGADASVSPDQMANKVVGTTDFIMRTPTAYQHAGTEFDDIVVWISQPSLVYELSRTGQ